MESDEALLPPRGRRTARMIFDIIIIKNMVIIRERIVADASSRHPPIKMISGGAS